MYAIIETGGKQYRVEPGTVVQVERLSGDVGSTVELSHVHFVQDPNNASAVIGKPWVQGARVTGEIIRQGRTRSIRVFKKKRRKNYRRTKGHRQGFTELRITEITM